MSLRANSIAVCFRQAYKDHVLTNIEFHLVNEYCETTNTSDVGLFNSKAYCAAHEIKMCVQQGFPNQIVKCILGQSSSLCSWRHVSHWHDIPDCSCKWLF